MLAAMHKLLPGLEQDKVVPQVDCRPFAERQLLELVSSSNSSIDSGSNNTYMCSSTALSYNSRSSSDSADGKLLDDSSQQQCGRSGRDAHSANSATHRMMLQANTAAAAAALLVGRLLCCAC